MALNNLGVGIVFTGRDELSGVMGKLGQGLGGVQSRAAAAGKALKVGLGVGAVGAAITAGAFKLASAAGTFEQELARVANISGAGASSLRDLRDAAIDAGIATQFSPEEAVGGLVQLSAAGFNASDSMELLTTSLNLAAAGQIGIEQATSTVATVMKGFGRETSDAASDVDKMVLATSRFKLQIEDLNLGLGKTIRGASLTNQSLDEMIVGLGIAKNTILDVSEAGNSISSALLQISKRSDLIRDKLGVNVLNAQGQFKDWLDLVIEVGEASERRFTNAAERAAFLNKAVGRFGLSAFSTTLVQIRKFASETGVSLQDAARMFREQIGGAEGTAQKFADNLLDTFKGSTTLLRGTLQTLAIVVGEPFAQVLKPVVRGVTALLNGLIQVINRIPGPIKRFVAGLFAAAGVVIAVGGGVIALRAAMILLVPIVKAMVASFWSALVATAPLIPAILAVSAVIAGFVVVFQRDVGGIASAVSGAFEKVSLFFRALVQVIRDGGFSGAVREELGRAENAGLKSFVIALFRIGFRIKEFFRGIRIGFTDAIESMAPTIGRLRSAFGALGDALGLVAQGGADAGASIPSGKFLSAGARFGQIVARVFQVAAEAIALFVRLWAGLTRGFGSTVQRFSGVFREFFAAIGDLLGSLGGVFDKFAGGAADSMGATGTSVQNVGEIIGGAIAGLIVVMVKLATWAVKVTDFFVEVWESTLEPIINVIKVLIEFIERVIEILKDMVGILWDVAEAAGGVIDSVGDIAGDVVGLGKDIVGGAADVAGGIADSASSAAGSVVSGVRGLVSGGDDTVARAIFSGEGGLLAGGAQGVRSPQQVLDDARSSLEARGASAAEIEAQQESARQTAAAIDAGFRRLAGALNVTIPVSIDGAEIARASTAARRDQQQRGFLTVTEEEFGG